MYRIRFHGRGGQGMKTAGRILGSAFFNEGFEVQDAPLYGAERRGAPIFAYVRAARRAISERGVMRRPDLVIVADDTLAAVPAAGVLAGVDAHTVVLINTAERPEVWKHRLNITGPVLTLPVRAEDAAAQRYIGATCAGAAARVVGVISRAALEQAIRDEIAPFGLSAVEENLARALAAYDLMADHGGVASEGGEFRAEQYEQPAWIDLGFDAARISAPAIHAAATSERVQTGLWRTATPVIDYSHCNRCWWVCSTFCPDSAIRVDEEGYPQIDYEHCKGCMICVAQCPAHAIQAVMEPKAAEGGGA
ncbi:MAG: 2-oxoacid:acceptor oxidoreductase family protein [Gammaproteobacteria bacterium]|nr:2-oxoacid:acceptor oxidoreductase family protein [Gammaproteobacteria bacterium]